MLARAPLFVLLLLGACRDPAAGPPGHVPLTPAQKARLAELTRDPQALPFAIGASLGGGRIELLGADVEPRQVRPGIPIHVTWYWACVTPLDDDQRVFVHLEDGQGTHLGNADHLLAEGLVATSTCTPGTVYADPHTFTVSPGPKELRLRVGLYRLDRRVPVDTPGAPGDRVAGPTLEVVQPDSPASIAVPRAASPPIVDGDLSDAVWQASPGMLLVRSLDGGTPALPTSVRLVWSGSELFVAFEVKDPDVWATLTGRDAPIYEEETVELFAGPAMGGGYKEVDLSPADVLFDASFTGPRQGMDVTWESKARHAVHVSGTLQDRNDQDQGFTAELAIPLERLGVRPEPGAGLILNVYRLDRPRGGAAEGSALSPPMRGDFHAPDRFVHAVLE